MTHDELVVSLIRSGLLRQYEMQINELSDGLVAAKAELAATHKDNERQKRLATISRLCKTYRLVGQKKQKNGWRSWSTS